MLEPGVIWVGSNDGPFHVTRDNGKTWKNVTPKDLPPGGRVQWIEASPHRRGSAYYRGLPLPARRLPALHLPHRRLRRDLERLTDGANGIPADWPTRVVREDPDREGLLYAGTEFGMFISFDNGGHWQTFGLNLPNVPITDIKVYKKDLVVATQGRAFWILDNITSLHQIGARTSAAETRLLTPRDGYRTRVAPSVLGPNIEYYLPTAPTGPVVDGNPRREGRSSPTATTARRRLPPGAAAGAEARAAGRPTCRIPMRPRWAAGAAGRLRA